MYEACLIKYTSQPVTIISIYWHELKLIKYYAKIIAYLSITASTCNLNSTLNADLTIMQSIMYSVHKY